MVDSINRRERKKLHAKQAIIEAAVTLFLQKGFNETSIAEIMKEADMGLGTFYNYFQSKEEILKHFLGEMITKTHRTFLDLKQETSSLEKLRAMFLATGKMLDEHRFVMPLFLSVAHKGAATKTTPSSRGSFKNMFVSIIKEGQQQGELRADIPAEVVAEMFHAIFQAASFSSLEMPFMENVEYKLQLVLDGLAAKNYYG